MYNSESFVELLAETIFETFQKYFGIYCNATHVSNNLSNQSFIMSVDLSVFYFTCHALMVVFLNYFIFAIAKNITVHLNKKGMK